MLRRILELNLLKPSKNDSVLSDLFDDATKDKTIVHLVRGLKSNLLKTDVPLISH